MVMTTLQGHVLVHSTLTSKVFSEWNDQLSPYFNVVKHLCNQVGKDIAALSP